MIPKKQEAPLRVAESAPAREKKWRRKNIYRAAKPLR